MSHDVDNTTPPPPPLRQTTNDRGVCEQTTVPGCAQTTLAALAKRQFGGLKRHLCHTLELGATMDGNCGITLVMDSSHPFVVRYKICTFCNIHDSNKEKRPCCDICVIILCFIYVHNAMTDAHIIYGSTTLLTNIRI